MNEYGGEVSRGGGEKKRSEYGSEYGGGVDPRKRSEYGGSVDPRKRSEYGGSVDGERGATKNDYDRSKWDDRRSPEPVSKYK